MNGNTGEHRPPASAASPWVSGRLFLGGLLPSRARLRFAGLASVPPSTIPAQSTPINLSSFSCLTHGVQFNILSSAKDPWRRRFGERTTGSLAVL